MLHSINEKVLNVMCLINFKAAPSPLLPHTNTHNRNWSYANNWPCHARKITLHSTSKRSFTGNLVVVTNSSYPIIWISKGERPCRLSFVMNENKEKRKLMETDIQHILRSAIEEANSLLNRELVELLCTWVLCCNPFFYFWPLWCVTSLSYPRSIVLDLSCSNIYWRR